MPRKNGANLERCFEWLSFLAFFIITYFTIFANKINRGYTTKKGVGFLQVKFKLGIAVLQQKSGVANMTEEIIEEKVKQMECDIKEIKSDLKNIPDEVAKKVNESVDMKIKLAIAETEKKYMGKFIALLIGLIGEGVGLIISFIK